MATENTKPITPVLEEELLYRSVGDTDQHHGCDPKGNLIRVGNSAFNDPDQKPSVDRVSLRDGGAQATRFSPEHGVVTLGVKEIRSISTVISSTPKGVPLPAHVVDVAHAPEPQNYSHALVETAPHAASKNTFKKLKEALSRLATTRGWAYPPASQRNEVA